MRYFYIIKVTSISIHALLAESDGLSMLYDTTALIFLSTLSLRRATATNGLTDTPPQISIHALLAESDHAKIKSTRQAKHFYPRSPCGERPRETISIKPIFGISIHALLAESDTKKNPRNWRKPHISIHALLAESDLKLLTKRLSNALFLSTLSLRRATPSGSKYSGCSAHFYPRSPCGERRTSL